MSCMTGARETLPGIVGHSMMTAEERDAVLRHIPPAGSVLEIGTASGATAAWLAKQRPAVQFVSVDIFVGGNPGEVGPDDWFANKQPNMNLWVGTLVELVVQFGCSGREFDVAIIDGNHSERGCYEDLAAVEFLVCSNGTIVSHDYGSPRPQTAGVRRAVDRFCDKHNWKIVEEVGWLAFLNHT